MMSKHQKSLLVRSVFIGASMNVARLTEKHDIFLNLGYFLLFSLFMSGVFYIVLSGLSSTPITVQVTKNNNSIENSKKLEYELDWRYRIILQLGIGILTALVVILTLAIPLMEWFLYKETGLFQRIWNPFSTPIMLIYAIAIGVSWLEIGKARISLTSSGIYFQSWLISAKVSWNDVVSLKFENRRISLIATQIDYEGSGLIVKYWELFHEIDNSIPLSLFSWNWNDGDIKKGLRNYLLFDG